MKLPMDRTSCCAADDIDSHRTVIDVPETNSLIDLIDTVLSSKYLPPISGGRATWIIEAGQPWLRSMISIKDRHYTSITEHRMPLGVIAQQWERQRFLVSEELAIGKLLDLNHGVFFNYWCQADPHLVFLCLRDKMPLPDRYGRKDNWSPYFRLNE